MTTNDIDAIRKLTDAATPGPWTTGADKEWSDALPPWALIINANYPLIECDGGPQGVADAEFIAAARTLVPALCDEIEGLRADVESLTDDVAALRLERDALAAKVDAYRPVAFPSGEQLYVHRCNNVEWWHEATQGPINDQGCDACESAPFSGGWRPVYVREVAR